MTGRTFAYLDECVDYQLVEALRKRGFLVTAVFDENTQGLTDDEQLEYAAKRDWVLITHNDKHFGHERQRNQPRARILVIPARPPFRRLEIRAAMLLTWLSTLDARSGRFKWGQLQELLEKGYCPPGFSPADVQYVLARSEDPLGGV
jgi:Domain of unknown function (DUF5615)